MGDGLAGRIAAGGWPMYPLLLLLLASPFMAFGFYVLGLMLKNKAWALRFAVVNLGLGASVPLLSWAFASWRARSALQQLEGQVAPEDWATIQAAARSEMLNVPWAALLSSPWLVASGLALLGVALLGHPTLAKPAVAAPPAAPLPPTP